MSDVMSAIQKIKFNGLLNGDSLEKVVLKLLREVDSTIKQKKNQIERILGEITQLSAINAMLVKVLNEYSDNEINNIADKEKTEALMAVKKAEADKRLQAAIESEGLPLNISQTPEKSADPTPILVEETKKKRRNRRS